jgi:hypothetical protein
MFSFCFTFLYMLVFHCACAGWKRPHHTTDARQRKRLSAVGPCALGAGVWAWLITATVELGVCCPGETGLSSTSSAERTLPQMRDERASAEASSVRVVQCGRLGGPSWAPGSLRVCVGVGVGVGVRVRGRLSPVLCTLQIVLAAGSLRCQGSRLLADRLKAGTVINASASVYPLRSALPLHHHCPLRLPHSTRRPPRTFSRLPPDTPPRARLAFPPPVLAIRRKRCIASQWIARYPPTAASNRRASTATPPTAPHRTAPRVATLHAWCSLLRSPSVSPLHCA